MMVEPAALPGVAADRDGAVRQQPLQGRPRHRLCQLAQPGLDRYRPRPNGDPPRGVPGRVRLERFVEYLVDVPMYFVYRNGTYHDVAGKSCRDFMAGRLEGFEGQLPNDGRLTDHLTTVFTEVRLKKFLEMRGADAGPPAMLAALPALWVGLLYDDAAQKAAWALVRDNCTSDIFFVALHRAPHGPVRPLVRPHRARTGPRRAGDRRTGPPCPRAPQRRRRGRDEIPRTLVGDRGERPGRLPDRWRAASLRDWHGDVRPVFAASALYRFKAEMSEALG